MCDQCQVVSHKAFGRNTLRRLWGTITGAFDRRIRTPRIQDRAYNRYLNHFNSQVNDYAQMLTDGRINTREWRRLMAQEISRLHLTADVAGAGGLPDYTQADLQRAQRKIDEQLEYLDSWVSDLQSQDVRQLNPDSIAARSRLYGSNATSTVQNAYTQALGLPDLPAQPGDGSTDCLVNCKCRWRIKKLNDNGDWDCTWSLGIAEHCDTCQARAREWSPLKIRGGEIQTNITKASLWR